MTIEIDDKTYKLMERESKKTNNGDIPTYLKELMEDITEITPTREEKKKWKEYLYNSCVFLASERPEFMPRKKDSLDDLKSTFFNWARTYNDGYFNERDYEETDRYCAWLVQEYDRMW